MGRCATSAFLYACLIICAVHPDSDFDCMGVLMEHSQDVKSVAWHPTEEVITALYPEYQPLTEHQHRYLPLDPTTILSNFT